MDKARIYDENWSRVTDRNRIWGVAKDPYTIFVYWELDDIRKGLLARHFRTAYEELPLHLCVYDVTGRQFNGWNAPLVSSTRVSPGAESWYLHQLTPGRDYLIDLATTTIRNQFFSILQTTVVRLPATSTSFATQPTKFSEFRAAIQPTTATCAGHGSMDVVAQGEDKSSRSQIPYEDVFDGYHVVEREEVRR